MQLAWPGHPTAPQSQSTSPGDIIDHVSPKIITGSIAETSCFFLYVWSELSD